MNRRGDGVNILPVDLGRRQMLGLLATIAAGGLTAVLAAPARDGPRLEIVPDTLTDPGAAERFGRAYLAAYPAEADRETLLGHLEAALFPGGTAVRSGAEAVFTRFDRVVRGEYADGEVIVVAGWLLSRSEARLYALSVLYREG